MVVMVVVMRFCPRMSAGRRLLFDGWLAAAAGEGEEGDRRNEPRVHGANVDGGAAAASGRAARQ